MTDADTTEPAQHPQCVANRSWHRLGGESEHDPAGRLLRTPFPPCPTPTEPQPLPCPADLGRGPNGPLRTSEELELAVPAARGAMGQELKRKPIAFNSGPRRDARRQAPAHAIEPPFLALQAGEDLPLPALLDPLNPHRRDVDRHSVREPRAEQSMYVRVDRAVLAAVLMDRENALSTSSGAGESPLDSVAQDHAPKDARQSVASAPPWGCRRSR